MTSIDNTHFEAWLADWRQLKLSGRPDLPQLSTWHAESLYDENIKKLLRHTTNNSPFLSKLLLQYPEMLYGHFSGDAATRFETLMQAAILQLAACEQTATFMHQIRQLKAKAALLIALADISGEWSLKQVTLALSQLAEHAVQQSLNFTLKLAAKRGEIRLPNPEKPSESSGIIIFGMGKLGAYELNYSSDIDLIVFYEPGKLAYQGKNSEQKFLNKITQDMVQLLHERTVDGYVFRTDLRLRPDPSSTPLAVSVDAAMNYYEGVGQNWERAAMIKARTIAGDMAAGAQLLKQLVPFVWRKNLDFATIQDILSIKRQINHKVGSDIKIAGHNIKLGKGGIREIEFFVQLHQLIWGGRQPSLRTIGTLETLEVLVELKHITSEQAEFLRYSYIYYRTLEHRLQMVADQQTHSMPFDESEIARIADFMHESSVEVFSSKLQQMLIQVHDIFVNSFHSEDLAADVGNLVFTGTNFDADTINTLQGMGFDNAEAICETIMGWHHGSRRCTRTKRSRQLLTELIPNILKALSSTANPGAAFLKFDTFLKELPAGVQIFSLFSSNPELLELIASIMGSAPALSATLSKQPELIESALFGDFYHSLPSNEQLTEQLDEALADYPYFDDAMERLRVFKNEKQFQAGVQLLKQLSSPERVSSYLSILADLLLKRSVTLCMQAFQEQYGTIDGAAFAILALGKLGSNELTFGSDIDLVFLYKTPDFNQVSDGSQQHSASVYYNRFAQRLVNAVSTVGINGQLFEVDTRLRPSGKQGLLAVSIQAFEHYFSELAWTFEKMALVKARVVHVAGASGFKHELETCIADILKKPRVLHELAEQIADMRNRVEQEFNSDDYWDLKHTKGGLMDIDFAAQLFVLGYAASTPELVVRSSSALFAEVLKLPQFEALKPDVEMLLYGSQFISRLQHILRLSTEDASVLTNPPAGLAQLLCNYMDIADFESLKNQLQSIEQRVRFAYMSIMTHYLTTH